MSDSGPFSRTIGQVRIREAVGVFHEANMMEDAVNDLEENGFDRAMISLLSTTRDASKKLGLNQYETTKLQDAAEAPRHAFISSDAIGAAKGALMAGGMGLGALLAAGISMASDASLAQMSVATLISAGIGLIIGSLLARRVQRNHDASLQQQIETGGLVLWVRTMNASDEKKAAEVLRRNGASDVHIHSIEV